MIVFYAGATFVNQEVTHTGLIKWLGHAYFVLCMYVGVKPACDWSVTLFTSHKRISISMAIWSYYTSSWHQVQLTLYNSMPWYHIQIVILIRTAAIEHYYWFSCNCTNHWTVCSNKTSHPEFQFLFLVCRFIHGRHQNVAAFFSIILKTESLLIRLIILKQN